MAKKNSTKKVVKKTVAKVATKKPLEKSVKKVVKKDVKSGAEKTEKKASKKAVKVVKAVGKMSKKTVKSEVKKQTVAKKPVVKKDMKKDTKKVVTKKVSPKVAKKTTTKVTSNKVAKKAVAKKNTAKKELEKRVVAKNVSNKTPVGGAKKLGETKVLEKAVNKNAKKLKVKASLAKVSKTALAKKKDKKADKVIKETSAISAKKTEKIALDADIFVDEQEFALDEDSQLFDDEVSTENEIRDSIADEVLDLSENHTLEDIFSAIKSMDFFSQEADECIESGCENPATTLCFCRFHYIKNWMDIKKKQSILVEGKLQRLVEDLVTKYPVGHVEGVLTDLSDDKTFRKVLSEMNIDSESDFFDDSTDDVLEYEQDMATELRGASGKESGFEED